MAFRSTNPRVFANFDGCRQKSHRWHFARISHDAHDSPAAAGKTAEAEAKVGATKTAVGVAFCQGAVIQI